MDSRLLNSAHYYLDIRNPTLDDIISLDPTTVQGFSKIKANVLVNIIPLVSGINEDPHFGLNAFFYAFFNKMHILTYTPAGSAKAHGGYLKNFMLDSIANTIIPINERGDEFLTDIQSSCLVFLSHDWMHKENYEFFFKKGEAWSYYRTLYDSVMDNRGNNQFFKADLSVLFILIHELYYNIDNHAVRVFALDSRDMKEIVKINDCRNIFEVYLASFYPSAAHLIPALAKKYEISHPLDYEISKRHGAIFEAYDMMSLLEYCGLELRYNDEEPWTWGPIVSQAIIKHLRTSEMGRKFYEKIPQYSLE